MRLTGPPALCGPRGIAPRSKCLIAIADCNKIEGWFSTIVPGRRGA